MITKFITLFKEKLSKKLEAKTSWGRNDLKLMIEETLSETLAEMLS